ncbi:MAG: ribosome small subunit-dependent GTPase A [Bacteroides sp.]|nr:ribosome small subunit-dependent GTPase A [Bacteroides sp.]
MNTENRIISVSGGIYTVETPEGTISARSRGVFRQKGIKPVTGDYVELRLEENAEPVISEVLERKNVIIRPPLANLDMAVLVVSSCEPAPNLFVLDKLTAIFESKGIETVYAFTKIDRVQAERYAAIYENIGYKTFMTDNVTGEGSRPLADCLRGKTSALIGNTGVGKSSLMNHIAPVAEHKTSEISKKLGRGRHTTREVRLYRLDNATYIADTPGFSTVEVSRYGNIPSEEVAGCFREFSEYTDKCRFKDCAHIKEESCAVREAVRTGRIAVSRHESYCKIYDEAVNAVFKYK